MAVPYPAKQFYLSTYHYVVREAAFHLIKLQLGATIFSVRAYLCSAGRILLPSLQNRPQRST